MVTLGSITLHLLPPLWDFQDWKSSTDYDRSNLEATITKMHPNPVKGAVVVLLFIQPSKAISPFLMISIFQQEGHVMVMELPGMLDFR